MDAIQDIGYRIEQLIAVYGDGSDAAAPDEAQWRRVLERAEERPLTLINFFKLRETAAYPTDVNFSGSGREAFERYAQTSIPSMEKAGGRFLLVAPYEYTFLGRDEDWDIIAIGRYPNRSALLTLFDDPAYQKSFFHRTAACARQKVLMADG